jgi:mono/diheme cytochrome c family protein
MAEENTNSNSDENSKLIGLVAQFDDPDSLVNACEQARQAGYTKTDAFSPFPVHGIDPALGIKRTILPFIVLGIAVGAVFVGVGMQWYTNGGSLGEFSTDESPVFPGYRFKISGKPYFSLPANIPVAFEVIVLSSAFATFFGMWFLNKLPLLSNPLHRISRFKRATNDKFFLMIEQADEQFDRGSTETQLNEWGAVSIDECRRDLTDHNLPSWLRLVALMGAILLLLPPVAIFRAMGMTSRAPRLHVVPDMDWQDKSKTQTLSPIMMNDRYLFADERVMRAPVSGSVARGQLDADTELYEGIKSDYVPTVSMTTPQGPVRTGLGPQDEAETAPPAEDVSMFVTEFPKEINVDEALLQRGQSRFNIYCAACHGYAANGDGLVNQRALALAAIGKAQWTSAKSLHDATVSDPEKNPLGRIFETISKGRGTMGPYGAQIPTADRWAIVAYVKALQETGIKPVMAINEDESNEDESNEDESNEDAAKEDKTRPTP